MLYCWYYYYCCCCCIVCNLIVVLVRGVILSSNQYGFHYKLRYSLLPPDFLFISLRLLDSKVSKCVHQEKPLLGRPLRASIRVVASHLSW